MSKPVLAAFKAAYTENKYNVWRYDTPSPVTVLFCVEADSREHAEQMALDKINQQLAEIYPEAES